MSEKEEDGTLAIDHLELAAERGSPTAIKILAQAPPYPEELDYLITWVYELHGRSGASVGGILPLNYTTLKSWAEMLRIDLHPLEVKALVYLDSVMLSPTLEEVEESKEKDLAWPDRKE